MPGGGGGINPLRGKPGHRIHTVPASRHGATQLSEFVLTIMHHDYVLKIMETAERV